MIPTESMSQALAARMRDVIARAGLTPGPERPCSYLPDRPARDIAFRAESLPVGVYRALMDLNFRRSGRIIYRPACRTCRQCRALRVPVETFRANRSQRRCVKANHDLEVAVGPPCATQEKYALYARYLQVRHDRAMDGSWSGFESFLYGSPVSGLEIEYRRDGELMAVGIVDVEPGALSTVYCYFAPDSPRRSLGTFNVLWTIDYARRQGFEHVYLGYYIRDCGKMSYKASFRPCEILDEDGQWRRCD
jgi:arginine-tRNA-protein transferase